MSIGKREDKREGLQISSQTIKILKPRRKITITGLAENIGISQAYLSLILQGKRKLNPKNKFHKSIHKKLQNIQWFI